MEQQLQKETKFRLVNGGRVAPAIEPIEIKEDEFSSLQAKLPSILQTTLDLQELITLFQKQIAKVLSFDSYHYQNAGAHCDINTATKCHHQTSYTLEMNNIYLGDISISRRIKFDDSELKMFEDLLCTLVYPLRNSLMYKQAVDAAMRDGLTGLNNRAAYDNSLNREIELAHRHNTPLSLVVLDIDHFKKINDTYGHSSGDKALKQLADTIQETMRGSDIAFRYGGEEFTLVLSNTDAEAAKNVANRLRVAVSQLCCEDEKHAFGYTISLGIAQLGTDDTAFTLFDKADKALYKAKEAGRNAVRCA